MRFNVGQLHGKELRVAAQVRQSLRLSLIHILQVAHNYEEQGMKVLILKPQVDTKGGGELVSRLGVRRKACLLYTSRCV